eukprot:gene20866-27702_t
MYKTLKYKNKTLKFKTLKYKTVKYKYKTLKYKQLQQSSSTRLSSASSYNRAQVQDSQVQEQGLRQISSISQAWKQKQQLKLVLYLGISLCLVTRLQQLLADVGPVLIEQAALHLRGF